MLARRVRNALEAIEQDIAADMTEARRAREVQDEQVARIGFTVTKKVGNAVVRNRTRRRLKEAARLLLAEHPVAGHDLVVIGRDSTRSRPFAELIDDLRRALRRAGVA